MCHFCNIIKHLFYYFQDETSEAVDLIKSSAEARLLCYQQLSKSFTHQPEMSSKEKEGKNFCTALADELMKIPSKRLLSTKIKLLQLVQEELELSECKKATINNFLKYYCIPMGISSTFELPNPIFACIS